MNEPVTDVAPARRERSAARMDSPCEGRVGPGDRGSHLLRLSLDLQLDAMLLTLGAGAAIGPASEEGIEAGPVAGALGPGHADPRFAVRSSGSAGAAGAQGSGQPWRRWLEEDLESTQWLTSTALAIDSALPATFGAPSASESSADITENLLVRYEAMSGLLSDLVDRVAGRPGADADWLPRLQHALTRCRLRIEEVQRHRDYLLRAAAGGPHEEAGAAASSHPERTPAATRQTVYLPGELLG